MASETCKAHEMTLKDFERFHENQKELAKSVSELREKTTAIDQSVKSAHHRLDSQEEQTKAIVKMSTSIEYMAKQVEDTLVLLKEHDGRLNKLERAPGDNVLSYWKLLIGASITSIVGLLIGLAMNGGI